MTRQVALGVAVAVIAVQVVGGRQAGQAPAPGAPAGAAPGAAQQATPPPAAQARQRQLQAAYDRRPPTAGRSAVAGERE